MQAPGKGELSKEDEGRTGGDLFAQLVWLARTGLGEGEGGEFYDLAAT